MSYETRMYIVAIHRIAMPGEPQTGIELACIDLSACGDGPVGKLIASKTIQAVDGDGVTPPFALYARNSDRQQDAVELMWEKADKWELGEMKELADAIEDGYITTDCYGRYLGVMTVPEILVALKKERGGYRRFQWAISLLDAIAATWYNPNELRVVTYGH